MMCGAKEVCTVQMHAFMTGLACGTSAEDMSTRRCYEGEARMYIVYPGFPLRF